MKLFLLPLIAVFFSFQLNAQETPIASPIIFICDASGSMWGQIDGKTKMNIATAVLTDAVNKLPDNQQLGLVAYGHRKKGDCKDVEFLVNVENGTKTQVNQSLKTIKPVGKTPLAYSAIQVIDKLRKAKMKATIILVTDGIESCDGDICEVVSAAKKEGIDFRLHIIGFGLKDSETAELKCAAKAGDGQYYDAANADGLGTVLHEATASSVDDPKGNFSVYAIKNNKAIDAYVEAFKAGTKTSIDIVRTYQDTAFLYLPPGNYDLLVKPLDNSDVQPITVSSVQSIEEKIGHQTISFDAGKLEVSTTNNREGWDATVKIYAKADGKNVASGRTYGRAKVFDLNPGVYDLRVEALAMEGMETVFQMGNVTVKANETQSVQHNFTTGIAMIGAKSAKGLVDATVRIIDTKSRKEVAAGRTYTSGSSNPKKFILNPGDYEVKIAGLRDYGGKKETIKMKIKEGETFEQVVNF